jgi:DNA-directed RNA polymerase specialized sigma54-like protein
MNRELLEKPFTPEKIKQRDGNFGRTLDYVEGHTVIQRLNDAFGAGYSDDETIYVTPDIYVFKAGDDYEIVQNEDGLPKL